MRNQNFITPEQAARTDDYLRKLAQEKDTVAVHLQSLFGRCCLATIESTTMSKQIDLHRLNQDLALFAHAVSSNTQPDTLNLDPLLVLEADLMLRASKSANPVFATMTERIAQELLVQPSNILGMGRVRLMVAHLKRLAYPMKDVGPNKIDAAFLKSSAAWISAPLPELLGLAEHLSANGDRLDATQGEILSLIALAELRNYRVDVACKLLRLVLQHGQVCAVTAEALNYVALQRRRDGAYGFASPFLKQNNTNPGELDLALHLPMTLNATWLFHVAMKNAMKTKSLTAAA